MIRVKFFTKENTLYYRRQLPDVTPCWGECEFVFDPEAQDYDWVFVYDDLPSIHTAKNISRKEPLYCAKQHTILLTGEPSNIKLYGRAFVGQFGQILTSQEPWALRHPQRVYSQPAMRWFYGAGRETAVSYDALKAEELPPKTKQIATVCSTKKQKHTLHYQRFHFVEQLKKRLPELEVYGHGVREMKDKAESLRDYRYHVAIENHFAPHHFTEKLSDAFLGFTLPFYFGCPNAADYFPADSFIPIDINDVEGAYRIIHTAMENNEHEKRMPAIIEARRRVLEDYNLFAVLNQIITQHHDKTLSREHFILYSRRAARKLHPLKGALDLLEKTYIQLRNRFRNLTR